MQKQQILAQGAEAKIILNEKANSIIKHRISKSYRLSCIDEKLRKTRTKKEIALLNKASSIINVPKIPNSKSKDKYKIKMQFIKGKKLSEHLDSLKNKIDICEQIGFSVALLHNNDIIHGDLTTSNMIFNEKQNKVFFIDFGLGFISKRIEDKAVDLHLLRQALEAKHFQNWQTLFSAVLKGYKKKNKEAAKVLEQLKKVESRGRYKNH